MFFKIRLFTALALVLGPLPLGAADPHAGHAGHAHGGHDQHQDHAAHHAAHDHGEHALFEAEGPAPGLAIALQPDPMSGWNLQISTTHFRFAPEAASRAHRPGEGHAHLYVDGKKMARLYGHWFHIPKLAPGSREIKVSLNSNDHRSYARNGKEIAATLTVEVPETGQ